ncbi:EAL domain protein [compost metagenome]
MPKNKKQEFSEPNVLINTLIKAGAFDRKSSSTDDILTDALRSVRNLLGMQVAFLSEFRRDRRVFAYVDSDEDFSPINIGESDPLDESYCQRVVDGRLPELIRDARKIPEALAIKATADLPIGAHLSIPVRFSNGQVFGTFCCFSTKPDETLNQRDMATMRLFADFSGRLLEREVIAQHSGDITKRRIQKLIKSKEFSIVYQPIFLLDGKRVVGYEALCRFPGKQASPPENVFREAQEVGLLIELELATVECALNSLDSIPNDFRISVNVSPQTLLSGKIGAVINKFDASRIVFELTEHCSVEDYAAISRELAPLRNKGIALAIDDIGAGYSSFRHVLELKPELIKFDRSLIHNIHMETGNRALAAALVRFSEEMGIEVIAEGVETEGELNVLQRLGVTKIQGYIWGRPAPLPVL